MKTNFESRVAVATFGNKEKVEGDDGISYTNVPSDVAGGKDDVVKEVEKGVTFNSLFAQLCRHYSVEEKKIPALKLLLQTVPHDRVAEFFRIAYRSVGFSSYEAVDLARRYSVGKYFEQPPKVSSVPMASRQKVKFDRKAAFQASLGRKGPGRNYSTIRTSKGPSYWKQLAYFHRIGKDTSSSKDFRLELGPRSKGPYRKYVESDIEKPRISPITKELPLKERQPYDGVDLLHVRETWLQKRRKELSQMSEAQRRLATQDDLPPFLKKFGKQYYNLDPRPLYDQTSLKYRGSFYYGPPPPFPRELTVFSVRSWIRYSAGVMARFLEAKRQDRSENNRNWARKFVACSPATNLLISNLHVFHDSKLVKELFRRVHFFILDPADSFSLDAPVRRLWDWNGGNNGLPLRVAFQGRILKVGFLKTPKWSHLLKRNHTFGPIVEDMIRNGVVSPTQDQINAAGGMGYDLIYYERPRKPQQKLPKDAIEYKLEFPPLSVFEYQGNTSSTVMTLPKEPDPPPSRTLGGSVDALIDFLRSTEGKYVAAELGTCLFSLFSASNLYSVVGAILQFLASRKVSIDFFSALTQTFIYQGEGNTWRSLPESVQGVLKDFFSAFLEQIGSVVSECFGYVKGVVYPSIQRLAREVSLSMYKDLGKDISKMILRFLKELFSRVKSCVASRSLAPLWGLNWDPDRWNRHAEGILRNSQRLVGVGIRADIDGVKREFECDHLPQWASEPMVPRVFRDNVLQFLEDGRKLVDRLSGRDFSCTQLKDTIRRLVAFLERLDAGTAISAMRASPLFIVLYGQAGCGKTVLARRIFESVGRLNGYDLSDESVYYWKRAVNFQDGLNSQWCIVMDDVDQIVGQVSANATSYVEDVISLVNNAPYAVESASIEDKGRVKACPKLVIMTTNYPDCRLPLFSAHPPAFWRRVNVYATVSVREEYRKEGTTYQIDPQAAQSAKSCDLLDIDVGTYAEAGPRSQKGYIPFKCGNVPDSVSGFLERIGILFGQHRLQQQEFLSQHKTDNTDFCSRCGLDLSKGIMCNHVAISDPVRPDLSELKYQGLIEDVTKAAKSYLFYREFRHQLPLIFRDLAAFAAISGAVYYLVSTRLQGRVLNASGLDENMWIKQQKREDVEVNLSPCTWTREEMFASVSKSLVTVRCGGTSGYGSMVQESVVVFPTHYTQAGCPVIFTFPNGTEVSLSQEKCFPVPSNSELLACVYSEFPIIPGVSGKMWKTIDNGMRRPDETFLIGPNGCEYTSSIAEKMYYGNGPTICSHNMATKNGDCGKLLCVRFDSSYFVVGMHYAYRPIGSIALAACFTSSDIVSLRGIHLQGGKCIDKCFSKTGQYTFETPKISEVQTACDNFQITTGIYGTIVPPLNFARLRSKVQKATTYPYFQDLQEVVCGDPTYWGPPVFRGSMLDGKWWSPYQKPFKAWNRGDPDMGVLAYSVLAYLEGIEHLLPHGYATLSPDECLRGIAGSNVNSVNLATSIGPPFNRPKSEHVMIDDEDSYLSSGVFEILSDIERVLDNRSVPIIPGVCVLKDEVIKKGKEPRVFINLPGGFNLALKKYLAPVRCFMRNNMDFFESAVGINMTGPECRLLISRLQQVDPSLRCLWDGDCSQLDKSWSGYWFDAVGVVLYCIAEYLGVQGERLFLLVLSLKHLRYSMNNDLFEAFWNPSGHDGTVEFNGILLSLGERYTYFKARLSKDEKDAALGWYRNFSVLPRPRFHNDFRENVALYTYGDDNIKATTFELPPEYTEIWKEDLGITVTDALKTSTMSRKTWEEISFLKRTFVYDDEYQMYHARLDLKPLVRMCCYELRGTSISSVDRSLEIVDSLMRELAPYSKDLYDSWMNRVRQYLQDNGLEDAVELKSHEDIRKQLYASEPFEYQCRRTVLYTSTMTTDFTSSSSGATSDNYVTLSDVLLEYQGETISGQDEPSPPIRTQEIPVDSGMADTVASGHGTGVVYTERDTAQDVVEREPVQTQLAPPNPLGNFLERYALLSTFELGTSDTVFSTLGTVYPWNAFLTNPVIAPKVKNYKYIKGTLDVMINVTCPSGCFGLYFVTVLPNGMPGLLEAPGTVSGPSETLNYPNVMQTDHYAQLDMATSNNIEFSLPFLCPFDYAEIAYFTTNMQPARGDCMYAMSVVCYQPMATGFPSGQCNCTMNIYGRLQPGYELIAPVYQGRSIKGGTFDTPQKSTLSGSLGMISSAASMLAPIPYVGAAAGTVSAVASGLSKVAGALGFSREPAQQAPMTIAQRSVSSVANLEGPDISEHCSFTPHSEISPYSGNIHSVEDSDPMSYKDLFSRWTFVGSYAWANTTAVNTVLASIPVTPAFGYQESGGTNKYYMTTAGYVGLPFCKWRGDMEYLLIIPVSKFHRGMLNVSWYPGEKASSATDTITTVRNTIVDVSCNRNLFFRVGYMVQEPYSAFEITSEVNPVGTATTRHDRNGWLELRVQNPLVLPNSADATTNIFVFARGGSNMDFQVPRSLIKWPTMTSPTPIPINNLEYQSENQLGDDADDGPLCFDLVPSSQHYPAVDMFYGECVDSVRALCQKPSLSQLNFTNTDYIADGPFYDESGEFTWCGWFMPMFVGFAASVRYKILPKVDCYMGAWPSDDTFNFPDAFRIGTLAPLSFCGANRGFEFSIPYYSATKFTPLGNFNYTRRKNIIKTSVSGMDVAIYKALGSDIRCAGFRQLPVVSLFDLSSTPTKVPIFPT